MSQTIYAPSLAAIRPNAKEEIPVLDIGPYLAGVPDAYEQLVKEMRYALENIGFYFVVNHGISQNLIDGVFESARIFHALPLEQKMGLAFNEHNVGYVPLKGSTTRHSALNTNNKPNLVESFFVKRDLNADHPDVVAGKRFRGQNLWPQAHPEVRTLAMAYAAAAERLGVSLLPLYAGALDLPRDWFAPAFSEPMFTLRLSHYPQQPPASDDTFGLAPHTDTSFMTLLPQNKVQGLSVRLPNGVWVNAPAMPGSFLVNGGDLMRRWTNDRFLATPHRVINRSGQERYAAPFFLDCNYDWSMACIPTCLPADGKPSYPPIAYPEYLAWYRAQNYADKPTKDGVQLSAY
ncbi:2-oxoglutarate and iron-dependent oxygenase domain-containing protein [Variovorax sp. J31P207]|uniref:isopenicillin N synthase family dioxygenase n=1 Tax=Variovorax sp. J31P207 TaxID=3053510 RepID=UPI0025788EE9|nr:2-oxoglutarate and iron-dependent oxygenase domain-containing protein [Variovorax sp. J31P207]MDM0071582.1 2-oxoglutarate and iron-dependent oxygenase domain-containing protein [Variovorax sp. J31P207]